MKLGCGDVGNGCACEAFRRGMVMYNTEYHMDKDKGTGRTKETG